MNSIPNQNDSPGQSSLPPYTAFSSLKTALSVLREHGVPTRIDRSVWANKFSGAVVTQILTALRFLGLMTHEGAPTDQLRPLVNALDTDQWGSELKKVLERAYAPVFELDLQSATANQFAEKFREAFKAEGETARKCMTFFLNAAREASIPVSPYLASNVKPRSNGSARKKARPKRAVDVQPAPEVNPTPVVAQPSPGGDYHPFVQGLLKTLPQPESDWPLAEQAKWLQTAASIFGLIYKTEEVGFVNVEVKRL